MLRGLILRSVRDAPRANYALGFAGGCASRIIPQSAPYAGLLCVGFGGVNALGVCTMHGGSTEHDHPSVSSTVLYAAAVRS